MAEEKNPYKIILDVHRITYPHIKEPSKFKNDKGEESKPKYDTTFLIDDDHRDIARINAVMKKIYAANKEGKFKGIPMTSKKFWNPLRAGEDWLETHPDATEYEGKHFLKAISFSQPKVFDDNKEDIIDLDEIYGGCYCRAVLVAYVFNEKGNLGIGFFLNSLMKIDDGDRLGGFAADPNDYDDNGDDEDLG